MNDENPLPSIIGIAVIILGLMYFFGLTENEKENIWTADYKPLCELKSICQSFSEARQTCATAGSFENCLSVKMGGSKYYQAKGSCMPNGEITYNATPSFSACVFTGYYAPKIFWK
jgi:hypothetical protein